MLNKLLLSLSFLLSVNLNGRVRNLLILIKYTLFLGMFLKALSKDFNPCPSIQHCSVCVMCTDFL